MTISWRFDRKNYEGEKLKEYLSFQNLEIFIISQTDLENVENYPFHIIYQVFVLNHPLPLCHSAS